MTNLEQLHLFLKFHYAPDSDAKREIWNACCSYEYTEANVLKVARDIMDQCPGLTPDEIQMLNIVANPPAFANNDVPLATKLEEAVAACEDDTEAEHTTADEFLVALLESLGYPAVAETYRKVPKWFA